MMLRRITIILRYIHIITFVFAFMIMVLNKTNCFNYIYMLSLYQMTKHKFDLIIFACFLTAGISIIDLTIILTYSIKKIVAVTTRRNYRIIREMLIWGTMFAIALLSIYMYFVNYIIAIT